MKEDKNEKFSYSSEDLTPKVTGVGGVFFATKNPEETKNWYAKNLKLGVDQWGANFEFRNANRPEEINYLQWSPIGNAKDFFSPAENGFMVNYRVQNLEGLVKKLKANGVQILDEIESFDYGKFVHILDLDGNKIQLWEPIDHVFTDMNLKTTK